MDRHGWMEDLVVGERFAFGSSGSWQILVVRRLTKTQLIATADGAAYEYRFNRKRGRLAGEHAWSTRMACELTPQMLDEIKAERRVSAVRQMAHDVYRLVQKHARRGCLDLSEADALGEALRPAWEAAKALAPDEEGES